MWEQIKKTAGGRRDTWVTDDYTHRLHLHRGTLLEPNKWVINCMALDVRNHSLGLGLDRPLREAKIKAINTIKTL